LPRAPRYTPVVASSIAPSPPNLFVGTSGWAYPSWRPGFYPQEVPPRAFLHYYSAKLTTVEVNYTFRALPTKEQIQAWLDSTPPGFRFSFKAPQQITHFKRLRDPHEALAEFVASVKPVARAGKLGALLFQLPPNFVTNNSLLADLLSAPALRNLRPRLKVAFEFRHSSWFTNETYKVLRRYRAAMCIAENDELTTPEVFTAPFHYYRLRCSGGYSLEQLRRFAKRLTGTTAGHETFIYLKHEDEPTGALNASTLLQLANEVSSPAGVSE
jgi:uncharacterized protein YecE (DUF72 family)